MPDNQARSASSCGPPTRQETLREVDYAGIGDACARLASTEQPIAQIADAVGYGTFANFNRQFKLLTSMTPRECRAYFRRTACRERDRRRDLVPNSRRESGAGVAHLHR